MTNNIRKKKLNAKIGRCLFAFSTIIGVSNVNAEESKAVELTPNETEVIIRKQRSLDVKELRKSAETLISARQYKEAERQLTEALELLNKNSLTEESVLTDVKEVKKRLSDVNIVVAKELVLQAKGEEEVSYLDKAIVKLDRAVALDPNKNDQVKRMVDDIAKSKVQLTYLEDVDKKGLEEKISDDNKEIAILLDKAKLYYSLKRYSDTKTTCEEILIKDAFNVAATRLKTRVNKKLYKYAEERREATIQERLSEINWKWSQPVSIAVSTNTVTLDSKADEVSSQGEIYDQLALVIPKIKFVESDIAPIVAYIKRRAKKLDPEGRSLNIILQLDEQSASTKKVSIEFDDMPINDLVRYICKSAGLAYKIENQAIILAESNDAFNPLEQRIYPVQAGLIDTLSEIRDETTGSEEEDSGEFNLKDYFEKLGVPFPKGATIQYVPSISRLSVKNTPENLIKLQNVLRQLNIQPSQVVIETKFVEVFQGNLAELGFDWTIAGDDYNQLAGDRLMIGGTPSAAYGFDNTGSIVGSDASANLRNANSVGALGELQFDSLSPVANGTGNLAVSGAIGNIDFDMLIRSYEQKSHEDLLNAPKVTTQSGQTAILRVVNERYFPEDWEEPEVSADTDGLGTTIPSHPTFGEPRDVGVTLEVTPVVDADGYTIELEMKPEVLEFLGYDESFNVFTQNRSVGWVDDGGFAVDEDTGDQSFVDPNNVNNGAREDYELSVNTIPGQTFRVEMPVFSARTIDTKAMIWDGETVVLGGLVREKVNRFSDKIPVLGDIPFLGKIFSSEGENRVKTNLLIMLSARLVNPAGNPVRPLDVKGLPDFNRL